MTKHIEEFIEQLNETEAKNHLKQIVVNYYLKGNAKVQEDEFIKRIDSLLKLAAQEQIRKRSLENEEVKLNIPKLL